ncbi:MAG: ATP-binding domain-containing protein, partial [Gammaproteobacteria bacterium]|nr:ATP-binding domain-containing protein [Gammaproteobacteria bacterium]
DGMRRDIEGLALDAQVHHVLLTSGVRNLYAQEKGEKGQARLENLDELVNAAREYAQQERDEDGLLPMASFLAHASLEAGEGQGGAWDDCVQLMTLHSAKGLEFPVVFMAGMEEGLFPHQMSMDEPGRLEEERRLCYVGVTRARKQLYMSCAEQRRVYGQETRAMPSRFLGEIPTQFIREVRPRVQVMAPMGRAMTSSVKAAPSHGLRLGQRVLHPSFGEGVLISHEGDGPHARVQVKFGAQGTKWLVLAYAKLEAIG